MMRLSDPAERAVLEDQALERGERLRVVLCRFVLGGDGDDEQIDGEGEQGDGDYIYGCGDGGSGIDQMGGTGDGGGYQDGDGYEPGGFGFGEDDIGEDWT